jgi:predicted metal-binding protein
MFSQIDANKIKIDKRIPGLCKRPFYGHAHGCPNYGKKEGCPPCNFLEDDFLDFNREIYVIYTKFELGNFAEKMRITHPEWRDFPRQLYNPRRWQNTARKLHRKDILEFLSEHKLMHVDNSPEARGVNVSELMKQVGITLNWKWPPEHILENQRYKENLTYIISLAGYLKNSIR